MKNIDENTKVIVFRESLVQSIIADTVTVGLLGIAFWFNYTFMENSTALNWVIIIMMLLFMIAKAGGSKSRVFYSRKEVFDYLYNDGDQNGPWKPVYYDKKRG